MRSTPYFQNPENTMKKLALNLEDLAVESFDTSGKAAARGTVIGHDETTGPYVVCSCAPTPNHTEQVSCNGTCDNSACYGTCDASCGGTCDYTCDCTGDFRCTESGGQRICM